MSEQQEKVFIGKTGEFTDKFGVFQSIILDQEDLSKLEKWINSNGQVFVEIKKSKNGKIYSAVNTWKFNNPGKPPQAFQGNNQQQMNNTPPAPPQQQQNFQQFQQGGNGSPPEQQSGNGYYG